MQHNFELLTNKILKLKSYSWPDLLIQHIHIHLSCNCLWLGIIPFKKVCNVYWSLGRDQTSAGHCSRPLPCPFALSVQFPVALNLPMLYFLNLFNVLGFNWSRSIIWLPCFNNFLRFLLPTPGNFDRWIWISALNFRLTASSILSEAFGVTSLGLNPRLSWPTRSEL